MSEEKYSAVYDAPRCRIVRGWEDVDCEIAPPTEEQQQPSSSAGSNDAAVAKMLATKVQQLSELQKARGLLEAAENQGFPPSAIEEMKLHIQQLAREEEARNSLKQRISEMRQRVDAARAAAVEANSMTQRKVIEAERALKEEEIALNWFLDQENALRLRPPAQPSETQDGAVPAPPGPSLVENKSSSPGMEQQGQEIAPTQPYPSWAGAANWQEAAAAVAAPQDVTPHPDKDAATGEQEAPKQADLASAATDSAATSPTQGKEDQEDLTAATGDLLDACLRVAREARTEEAVEGGEEAQAVTALARKDTPPATGGGSSGSSAETQEDVFAKLKKMQAVLQAMETLVKAPSEEDEETAKATAILQSAGREDLFTSMQNVIKPMMPRKDAPASGTGGSPATKREPSHEEGEAKGPPSPTAAGRAAKEQAATPLADADSDWS